MPFIDLIGDRSVVRCDRSDAKAMWKHSININFTWIAILLLNSFNRLIILSSDSDIGLTVGLSDEKRDLELKSVDQIIKCLHLYAILAANSAALPVECNGVPALHLFIYTSIWWSPAVSTLTNGSEQKPLFIAFASLLDSTLLDSAIARPLDYLNLLFIYFIANDANSALVCIFHSLHALRP